MHIKRGKKKERKKRGVNLEIWKRLTKKKVLLWINHFTATANRLNQAPMCLAYILVSHTSHAQLRHFTFSIPDQNHLHYYHLNLQFVKFTFIIIFLYKIHHIWTIKLSVNACCSMAIYLGIKAKFKAHIAHSICSYIVSSEKKFAELGSKCLGQVLVCWEPNLISFSAVLTAEIQI